MKKLFNYLGDTVIQMFIASFLLALLGIVIGIEDGASWLYGFSLAIFITAIFVSYFRK